MKKSFFIFAMTVSAISLHAQTEHSYTEVFDSAFSNISRSNATTGILYERVVPFANQNKNAIFAKMVHRSNILNLHSR